MANRFDKYPNETYPITVDFVTGSIPTGTAPASGVLSAIDLESGANVSSSVLTSTTASVSTTEVTGTVKAGVAGREYQINFVVTLDDSSVVEERVFMSVE